MKTEKAFAYRFPLINSIPPEKSSPAHFRGASPVAAVILEDRPKDILVVSSQNKAITIKSTLIPEKTTRTAGGVTLLSMKGENKVVYADETEKSIYPDPMKYRKIKIPATGSAL